MVYQEKLEEFKPFLSKRQILLIGRITEEKQEMISGSILYLTALGSDPITFFIDSYGGLVQLTCHIYDVIQNSEAPIHGVVTGAAHSGAFIILQACQKRLAYPHATFLFHGPDLASIKVDQENLAVKIRENKKLHEEMLRMIARRSGQPLKQLREWSKEERHFKAREAKRFGFIDEIVRPKK